MNRHVNYLLNIEYFNNLIANRILIEYRSVELRQF